MSLNIVENFITKNDCYVNNVNRVDSRYRNFQDRGPSGLMLHSVGCAQPSAEVFAKGWNVPNKEVSVHAFIDANEEGLVRQLMPWNFRAWHCGGAGNNTHIGVEMCESGAIRYLVKGEPGYGPAKFAVKDRARAVADCQRAYHSAVELFAMLCKMWKLDPIKNICSHREGWYKGIASNHGDPEHYWNGLNMPYTMDGFRADVKKKMEEDEVDMTKEEVKALVTASVAAVVPEIRAEVKAEYEAKYNAAVTALGASYGKEIEKALESINSTYRDEMGAVAALTVTDSVGRYITHLSDIPGRETRAEFAPLLEAELIDGGTPKEQDGEDVRLPWSAVRAILVAKRYTDAEIRRAKADILLGSVEDPGEPEEEPPVCGDTCPIVFPDEDKVSGVGEE